MLELNQQSFIMGSLFNGILVSCCMAIVINCEGKFAN